MATGGEAITSSLRIMSLSGLAAGVAIAPTSSPTSPSRWEPLP